MKTIKKQKPIQRRKVLNLCTIFRLAKPAFFEVQSRGISNSFQSALPGAVAFCERRETGSAGLMVAIRALTGRGLFFSALVAMGQNFLTRTAFQPVRDACERGRSRVVQVSYYNP